MSNQLTQEDHILIQKVLKAIAILSWTRVLDRWNGRSGRKLQVVARLSLTAKGVAGIAGVFLRAQLKKPDSTFESDYRWSLKQKILPSSEIDLIAQALRERYPGRVSSTLGVLRGVCETSPSPEMIHEAFVILDETLGIKEGYKNHSIMLEADATSRVHLLVPANTEEEARQKAIQIAQADGNLHWITKTNSVRNIRLQSDPD